MEVVLIDSKVAGSRQLASAVTHDATRVLLTPSRNGVVQLVEIVSELAKVSDAPLTLHVVAPGAQGRVFLGEAELSAETLTVYGESLETLRGVVAKINLFACEVAQDEPGEAFISALCKATCAPVAASSTKVGASSLGGNWELDVTTDGEVVQPPFALTVLAKYHHVLHPEARAADDPAP